MIWSGEVDVAPARSQPPELFSVPVKSLVRHQTAMNGQLRFFFSNFSKGLHQYVYPFRREDHPDKAKTELFPFSPASLVTIREESHIIAVVRTEELCRGNAKSKKLVGQKAGGSNKQVNVLAYLPYMFHPPTDLLDRAVLSC